VQSPGTRRRSSVPAYKKGSDQRVISSGGSEQFALAVRGKSETSFDVFGFQIRKILENLFLRHTRSQILKHFVDGYTQTTDARLSTSFPRLHGDPSSVVHGIRVCLPGPLVSTFKPAPKATPFEISSKRILVAAKQSAIGILHSPPVYRKDREGRNEEAIINFLFLCDLGVLLR
jgi:hypothetical protein